MAAGDGGAGAASAGADALDDSTGLYAWPSGSKLAGELPALVDCRGAAVADLGCGLGRLGFAAAALGAGTVVFADGSPLVIARLASQLQSAQLGSRAQAVHHLWGDPLPGGPFALILGGDILYRPACQSALMATIAASLTRDGVCLLSDPRHRLADELDQAVRGLALAWTCQRRELGYSLARLMQG
jgi:predicted nicotinamide N-methyase